MLRVGFLPSDFHPMVLMPGETEDLRALAGVLRRFAREPGAMRLDALAFCTAANGTRIALMPGSDAGNGLHRPEEPSHAFAWHLDAARAAEHAERVEALADPACRAGSETLEDGEVAVTVSRGEFTDDFLEA